MNGWRKGGWKLLKLTKLSKYKEAVKGSNQQRHESTWENKKDFTDTIQHEHSTIQSSLIDEHFQYKIQRITVS